MHDNIIRCLTQVARRWLNPEDALRQAAMEHAPREFRLSPAGFNLSMDWIFSQWTEMTLKKIVTSNPFKSCQYAAQILAGNTPAVIAQGFLQAVVLHVPQCIKIPREQSAFARLLYQALLEADAELSLLLEVDSWRDRLPQFYSKLSKADVVLAYGSDETMAELKNHLAPGATYRAHGHRESAAVIFKEAAEMRSLEKLADDMLSYDQRGCLSPRITFVQEGGTLSPADCARLFAEKILPQAAKQLPRGGLFPGEAEEILHQRSVCGFRGPVYCGKDWTVSYAETYPWPREMLPRYMLFKPFATIEELMNILFPLKGRLLCLGYAGKQESIEPLYQILQTSISALGEMQKQLLIW